MSLGFKRLSDICISAGSGSRGRGGYLTASDRDPRVVGVEFLVGQMVLVKDFLQVLQFFAFSNIALMVQYIFFHLIWELDNGSIRDGCAQ